MRPPLGALPQAHRIAGIPIWHDCLAQNGVLVDDLLRIRVCLEVGKDPLHDWADWFGIGRRERARLARLCLVN